MPVSDAPVWKRLEARRYGGAEFAVVEEVGVAAGAYRVDLPDVLREFVDAVVPE